MDAVTVTVEDDEEQGLTLNPAAEDRSATYTVVLTSEPTAPVVRIGSDNPDVDTQPGLLQYTTSNWGTAQPVTVTQPATLDRTATITVRPPGADVPLVRGRYGFGPAGAQAVVDLRVAPVPTGGLDVCLPVPAGARTAAGARAVVLVRYARQQWEPVAGTTPRRGRCARRG